MSNLRERLAHYQDDIPDEKMLDEAIATIENYLPYKDEHDMLHHQRPLAIAYLALCIERDKRN